MVLQEQFDHLRRVTGDDCAVQDGAARGVEIGKVLRRTFEGRHHGGAGEQQLACQPQPALVGGEAEGRPPRSELLASSAEPHAGHPGGEGLVLRLGALLAGARQHRRLQGLQEAVGVQLAIGETGLLLPLDHPADDWAQVVPVRRNGEYAQADVVHHPVLAGGEHRAQGLDDQTGLGLRRKCVGQALRAAPAPALPPAVVAGRTVLVRRWGSDAEEERALGDVVRDGRDRTDLGLLIELRNRDKVDPDEATLNGGPQRLVGDDLAPEDQLVNPVRLDLHCAPE
eukprot:CAMPEP_0168434320 /NCGR_PEP_ID=MMETSP0228-20121227/39848_1 /TAXON_ID=133427 /ORGANISM="Protoceratium reticulatum, Strain CCCM 535 (=CCMP 1889)" /LENGTH=282 /DNA_ID=CAMNT_0008448479 /DNA_START=108 /DNA_END=953 /DNA_ORIENTATION=-